MSAETQPDPILPNYNPSSWDVPTLSPEERAILDTEYITFPIAQNQNITFPVAPTAPTLPDGTNTTQVATTGFVQNAIAEFLATINTWLGTQIFSVGMTTNTINPTTPSGTLLIGNAAVNTNVEIATSANRNVILHLGDGNNATSTGGVHIGNGATSANNVRILDGAGSTGTIFLGSATSTISLGCPLTPSYASVYSPTGTGTGKIGEVIDAPFLASTVTANGAPQNQGQFLSLPIGVWILSGSAGKGGFAGYLLIGVSTVSDSLTTGALAQDMMVTSSANNAVNSVSFIVTNTSVQNYYLVAQATSGGLWALGSYFFKAVRLA